MRDFEEEYKKYINEETPDLWNRIESQLEEKETEAGTTEYTPEKKSEKPPKKLSRKTSGRKIYPMLKKMIPAAAAILVLVAGISTIKNAPIDKMNSQEEQNESAAIYSEEAAAESAEEYSEETENEAVGEMDGEYSEETTEESADASDDALTAGIPEGESQRAENSMAADTQASSAINYAETDDSESVEIENAVLTGIAVADTTWKERGYTYIYHFATEDGSKIDALLSQSMRDRIETDQIPIARKKTYHIVVTPVASENKTDQNIQTAICILQELSE